MKNVIIIAALLLCACNNQLEKRCTTRYAIDIWNTNASMAFTIFYRINDDSLLIEFINGVEGGSNKPLLKKALTESERTSFCKCLSLFDIDTLKASYINPSVMDGDQKMVVLQVGNKTKRIEISNFYQKDMGGLFETVNNVVADDRYKIKYRR